jgi:SPP1 gp7 family putative phage head morphogenesis protein
MRGEHRDQANEIAKQKLLAWTESGVVKSVKWHAAGDKDVCITCREMNGSIVSIAHAQIGTNLPPLFGCKSKKCRCYFRPEEISTD